GLFTTIGVIDAGMAAHDDLELANGSEIFHVEVQAPWNGGLGNGLDHRFDPTGHGTAVAGALLGRGNADPRYTGFGIWLAGEFSNRLFLSRWFDDLGNPVGDVLDHYKEMANSYHYPGTFVPKVINCSWGTPPAAGAASAYSGTEQECIDVDNFVWEYGQQYVFAAGNDGPGSVGTIAIPAAAKNVLAVGNAQPYETTAGDNTLGNPAITSSRGPTSDGRIKPELLAPGGGDSTHAEGGVKVPSHADPSGYRVEAGGTSMAAPHISAMVASLIDHYPRFGYNAKLLRAFLMASAMRSDGNASPNSDEGFGWPDTYRIHGKSNGWDGSYLANARVEQNINWAAWDVAVPQGTTRLTVVLSWDEPPVSTTGGATPVMGHVDLRLKYDETSSTATNPLTGDFESLGEANYQYLVIDNPQQGNHVLKFFPRDTDIDDDGSIDTLKVAAAYFIDTEPVQPQISLSASATPVYLNTGDGSLVSATVSNQAGLAAMTMLNLLGLAPGLEIASLIVTLADGTQNAYSAAEARSGVVLGSIPEGYSRGADWSLLGTGEGRFALTVKANAGNAGGSGSGFSNPFIVFVDDTEPGFVSNLDSTTHPPDVWVNTDN
ncbi:MAG: S8 family serine peptidase, partial [Myxococcota bacterium]